MGYNGPMRMVQLQVFSWLPRSLARRHESVFRALDRALTDPPSMCCDADALCEACRADSAPWLVREAAVC